VFTDAFVSAWDPSEKPFMVGVLTFEEEGGKTRYTARVLQWTVADRDRHAEIGFEEGWGKCADQLEEVAAKL
jgi:uncharacterized protein YndB with AHSA1/START domain